MDLKTFYRRHNDRHNIRIALGILYISTAIVYFSWRLTVFNTNSPIFSSIFYLAELICLILGAMVFFLSWRVRVREAANAPPDLVVDVFVPTYNESVTMVRRTVRAAMNIAYPHETWLLDDGNRPQMRALAEELGCHYVGRSENVGAKPGNLNNALKFSTADFIAVIDCDHIAQRNYLHTLLGYFDDPDVAVVQAPQDYYNITAFQYRNKADRNLVWNDQSAFFQIGQAGRDYWDATTCCGTSTILRRSAIDEIGGFPTESVTEDMHLAVKMLKLGYKSIYYPLPLAYGVAPTDLGEYQKQRLRWGQGNVQTCREEGLPFCRNLTWAQRLCFTHLGFLYLEGWTRLVIYLTPPIVLLTGITPIGYTEHFFWFFVPYFLVTYLCFEEMGRGNLRLHINEQLCMARFPVYIASTFGMFRKQIKWRVSSKEFVGHLQIYLLLPQIALLLLNLAAIAATVIAPPTELLANFPISLIVFVCAWAAVTALMSFLVIQDAVRCARNRRPDYRFTIPLPLHVSVDGNQPVFGMVDKISTVGMSFFAPVSSSNSPEMPIKGTIFIPGHAIPFTARLEEGGESTHTSAAGKAMVTCVFEWQDDAARERLDMSLHSCDWHRRITFGGSHFDTPLEWFEKKLGIGKKSSDKNLDWRPALYRQTLETQPADRRFAVILASGWSDGPSLLVFQPQTTGTELTVTAMSSVGTNEMRVKIAKQKWPSEELATGLDMQNAYTYDVLVCEEEPPIVLQQAAE